jgi:hypothetical protein
MVYKNDRNIVFLKKPAKFSAKYILIITLTPPSSMELN